MAMATRRPRPFWLRPKWVVGHVLVVALVALAVSAGLWQLRRLDERRAVNAEIAARMEMAPAPIDQILDPDDPHEAGEQVRYRRATATGAFAPDDEVLIRSRSLNGSPGYWVLTPLVLDDGSAVAVNRGFVPFGQDLEAVTAAAPPSEGRVTVEGILFASERRQGIGPTDPPAGRLDALARVDVERLDQQVDADLYPVYLQQLDQTPPVDRPLPITLDPPAQDEGSHLSYAVQWFLFAAIGAVGWPILLHRTAAENETRPPDVVPRPEDERVRTPTPG
jgi:surfeit locus 1 family protein